MDGLDGRLYSITEVAKFLNVSRKTVQRMIWNRELRAYRIGGQYRIPPLAVEHMLRPDDVFDPLDESHKQLDLF